MFLLLLACTAPKDGDADPEPAALPADAWVLDDVTVVDADGARPHQAVIVSDGLIFDVRAAGDWGDHEVRDGAGRYVIPGLVDAHVHLNYAGTIGIVGDTLATNLAAQLAWGVTQVVDVGGPEVLFALRDRIEAGEIVGPHVLATGPMLTAVGSHPCETTPDPDLCVFVTAEDAGDAAHALLDDGADGIKVAIADAAFTPWGTPRIDVAAVAAAVATGAPVFAHIDTDQDLIDAVDAGVTFLAHPPFDGAIGPDALAAATEADAVFSTVGAFAAVGDLLDGTLDPDDPDLLLTEETRADWRAVRDGDTALLDGWAEASATWAADARANLAALDAAGARILPGSDAGYYFNPHGYGLHRELAELQAMGWTPLEVLTAATADSRAALGLPGGRIVPGAPADLVLLTADPTEDVANLQAIEAVILGGDVLERDTLAPPTGAFDDVCLSDCPDGERCDGVAHVCTDACTPYDSDADCGEDAWCMPADGDDADVGACHDAQTCDLYAQDCAPTYYGQACAPYDVDTNVCVAGGPRTAGQSCSWLDPSYACQPGLFCSLVDFTCYTLCDPAGDDCPGAQRCNLVETDDGAAWFGLCW